MILGVLIALAGLALFVAVQTVRDRRKFQPPMTTWYAAMLFAVMPLRNALPEAPPFGSWIDVTIVIWVIVVLVISMVLYISCWWRHLRPEPEKPASACREATRAGAAGVVCREATGAGAAFGPGAAGVACGEADGGSQAAVQLGAPDGRS